MILSPGLVRAKIVSTMASVEPMVTTISLSGSRVRPMNRPHFRARAWRKLGAPMVMGYWWGPCWLTSARRSSMAWGGAKSGKPWARLMAPASMAIRVIRRMTESVNNLFFLLISCMAISSFFVFFSGPPGRGPLSQQLYHHAGMKSTGFSGDCMQEKPVV